jgi:cytochrome c-type biogenesis protein CcmE
VIERLGARRVLLIAALGVAVLVGGVAASNLASSTVYYLTPSEAKARNLAVGQTIRLGGQVKPGSLVIEFGSPSVGGFHFVITDGTNDVSVVSSGTVGAVPGLLREGAGAVVEGSFRADGAFVASQVIAKHDEVYTAPTAGATPSHRTSFP